MDDRERAELAASYYGYDPAHPLHLGTSAYVRPCPLCGEEHFGCRFDTGSLFCVLPKCRNPHHRASIVDFPF